MRANAYYTDSRFGEAEAIRNDISKICKKDIIYTIVDAEPLGPKIKLDALIISPCTGNTLAKIANVDDLEALGMEMFKAKSNLDASPRDLIFRDFKDFDMGSKKIGIGQLEIISLSMISPELKAQLKSELAVVKSEGRDSAILVLTDIMKEGSEILVVSDDEDTVISALGATKSDCMWVDGIMSRKKQVVPPLQAAFKA
jgi:manganese-dependent inorganic pyrophosphatase